MAGNAITDRRTLVAVVPRRRDFTMDDFREEMKRRAVDARPSPRFDTADQRERRRDRARAPRALVADLLSNPDVSIKRLAWAFGCAKANSDEEIALYRKLVERITKARESRP